MFTVLTMEMLMSGTKMTVSATSCPNDVIILPCWEAVLEDANSPRPAEAVSTKCRFLGVGVCISPLTRLAGMLLEDSHLH